MLRDKRRKLRLYMNPLGKVVVATTLEEALDLVKKYNEKKGIRATGAALKYEVVPDDRDILVFARYQQSYTNVKASVIAKKMGFGIPNTTEEV